MHECDKCQSYCGPEDKIVFFVMVAMAVAISATIKFLLWRAERNSHVIDIRQQGNMELVSTALVQILIIITGFSIMLLGSNSNDPMLIRLIGCLNCCVTLPIMIFASKPKMRALAKTKIRQFTSRLRISPTYGIEE